MAKAVGGVAPANAAAEQAQAGGGMVEGVTRAEFEQLRGSMQSLADQLALTREENIALRKKVGELDAAGNVLPTSTLSTKHDCVPVGYVGPTWWVQIKHNPRIQVGAMSEGDAILKYQRYLGINFSEHPPVTSKGPDQVQPKEAPPEPPAPAPAASTAPANAAPPATPPVSAAPAAPVAPPASEQPPAAPPA